MQNPAWRYTVRIAQRSAVNIRCRLGALATRRPLPVVDAEVMRRDGIHWHVSSGSSGGGFSSRRDKHKKKGGNVDAATQPPPNVSVDHELFSFSAQKPISVDDCRCPKAESRLLCLPCTVLPTSLRTFRSFYPPLQNLVPNPAKTCRTEK